MLFWEDSASFRTTRNKQNSHQEVRRQKKALNVEGRHRRLGAGRRSPACASSTFPLSREPGSRCSPVVRPRWSCHAYCLTEHPNNNFIETEWNRSKRLNFACGISADFSECLRIWWSWHQSYQFLWNSAKSCKYVRISRYVANFCFHSLTLANVPFVLRNWYKRYEIYWKI